MGKISVENVSKEFKIKKSFLTKQNEYSQIQVLKDISFKVDDGEMIGIIGLNGSGKTTLLRTIAGIYKPDQGDIKVEGILSPLLQIGTGFHDELTARNNILIQGLLLGIEKKIIVKKIPDIIKFAELERFQEMKLKNYSRGMKARLAFSTALQIEPDILLVDEVLSVGDIAFKEKSFNEFLKFKEQKKTILYTSHSVGKMPDLCDRVILLHKGRIEMDDVPEKTIARYKELIKKEA